MRDACAAALVIAIGITIGNFASEIALEFTVPVIWDWLYGPFGHPIGELP